MEWLDNIRERQARLFVFTLLMIAFIKSNWGSSLGAIEHIILSSRAYKLDTIDTDLAVKISQTTIYFGQTCSKLSICFIIWVCFNKFIKALNLDFKFIDRDAKILIKENEELRSDLRKANAFLHGHIERLNHLEERSPILEKHADGIERLAVEAVKQKFQAKPIDFEPKKQRDKEPDLFEAARQKSRLNGKTFYRRRKKPVPKF